ncbi:MAG: hypothetical protein EXR62_07780 [Chloroflexi bacterium]|nr:hypothetical protein [Chloroflexota bacterium]
MEGFDTTPLAIALLRPILWATGIALVPVLAIAGFGWVVGRWIHHWIFRQLLFALAAGTGLGVWVWIYFYILGLRQGSDKLGLMFGAIAFFGGLFGRRVR